MCQSGATFTLSDRPGASAGRRTHRAAGAVAATPGAGALVLLTCMVGPLAVTGTGVASVAVAGGQQRGQRQPGAERALGGSMQDFEAATALELQAQWDSAPSWSPDSPLANCTVPPVSVNFVLPDMRMMLPAEALDGLSVAVSSAIRSASVEYGFKHYIDTASLEAGLQVLDSAGLTVRVDMCATGTPIGGATAVAEAGASSTSDVSPQSAGVDDVDDSGNAQVELWEDKTRTAAWCALRDTPIYGLIGQLKLSRPWGDGSIRPWLDGLRTTEDTCPGCVCRRTADLLPRPPGEHPCRGFKVVGAPSVGVEEMDSGMMVMVESPGWLDLCTDLDPDTGINGDALLAFLFRGLSIPSHATIRAATLMFVAQTANTSHSADDLTVEISAGTDTAALSQMAPAIFGITYRGRSQSTSEWRVPAIERKGQKMETDVRQMVQEMVFDTTWARNSTLTFMFRTVSGAGIRSLDPANIQLRVDYYTNECGERNGTKGQQASTDAEASTGANLVVIVLSSVVIVGMVLFALSKSTRVRAIFARNPGGNEAESSVASKSTDEPNRVPTKPTRPVSVVIGPRPGAKINTVQMDWESTESPGFVPGHNYSGVGGGGSGLYTEDDGSTTYYEGHHMRVMSPAGGSASTRTGATESSGPMYDNRTTNAAMLQQHIYDAARAATDPSYMAPQSQAASDPAYMYAQLVHTGEQHEYRPVLPMAPARGPSETYNLMQQRSAMADMAKSRQSRSSTGSELPYNPNGVEYMPTGSFNGSFFEQATEAESMPGSSVHDAWSDALHRQQHPVPPSPNRRAPMPPTRQSPGRQSPVRRNIPSRLGSPADRMSPPPVERNRLQSSPLNVGSSSRPFMHSTSANTQGMPTGRRSVVRPLVMRRGNTASANSSSLQGTSMPAGPAPSFGGQAGVFEGHHDMRRLEHQPTRQQRMVSGQSQATAQDPGGPSGDARIADYHATGGMDSLPPDPWRGQSTVGGDMYVEPEDTEFWNPATTDYRASPTTTSVQMQLSPRPLSQTPLPPSPWEGQRTPSDAGYMRVPSAMSPMTPNENGGGNQGYLSIPSALSPQLGGQTSQASTRLTPQWTGRPSHSDLQESQETSQNYIDQRLESNLCTAAAAAVAGVRVQSQMAPQRTARPTTARSEASSQNASSDQREYQEMTQNYMDQMMENLNQEGQEGGGGGGGGGQRSHDTRSHMTWQDTHDSV